MARDFQRDAYHKMTTAAPDRTGPDRTEPDRTGPDRRHTVTVW